jgi:hypothetical protein
VTDQHDHSDLIARLDAAPWHHSPGYNREDGSRVTRHSYILAREGQQGLIMEVKRLCESADPCVWRGRYQGRPHVYRYLTLADGYTYWHMGGNDLINRDHISREEREVQPRRSRDLFYPGRTEPTSG